MIKFNNIIRSRGSAREECIYLHACTGASQLSEYFLNYAARQSEDSCFERNAIKVLVIEK